MRILQATSLCIIMLTCLAAYGQQRLTKGKITVVHPPRAGTQARTALALYEHSATRVKQLTSLPDPGHVTIELADSDIAYKAAFRRLRATGAPEYALAVAFSPENLILIRSTHLRAIGGGNLPETLTHETFHLYLAAMLRRTGQGVPLWFNEGVAQWVAGQQINPQLLNRLRTDAKGNKLRSLASLSENFPPDNGAISIAYAQSLSFIQWLQNGRSDAVEEILLSMKEGSSFHAALLEAAGENLNRLEAAWHKDLARKRSFLKTFLSQLTLFSVLSLIALVAFLRYLRKRKKLLRKLEEEDRFEDYGQW